MARWLLGAVLVLTACTAPDGGPPPPSTTAALPTATTTTSTPAPTGSPAVHAAFKDMPDEFYGVLRGRIAELDSVTGKRTRWLTSPPRGFVDGSPALVPDERAPSLVFARTRPDAPCGTARILRVTLDGLRVTEVYRPVGVLTASAVTFDLSRLAYTFTACEGGRARLRVVSLPDKAVVGAARSEFRGEGVVSVLDLSTAGYTTFVTVGLHQQSWVAIFDLPPGQGEVSLDELRRLPMPGGCVATGGVVGVARRDGTPYGSEGANLLALTCQRADGYDVKLATYDYDTDPTVERVATAPEFYEVTGNESNFLIGLRGEDDGTRYVRRVLQVAGTEERVLGACRSVDGTSDACVTDPVW